MKNYFKSFTTLSLLAVVTFAVTSCSYNADKSPGSSQTSQVDRHDYSAYITVLDQAIFFETQTMIALDQLGLEKQNLPPVSTDSTIKVASNDPVDDFIWENPYGYLSDVPPAFKEQLEELVRDIWKENDALSEVRLIHVAEHSQLVPESSAEGVTEDVLSLIVIKGMLPNGLSDWIATAVVKLDDWSLKQYDVNPNLSSLATLSSDQLDSHTTFIPANVWASGFSFRRVVDDALYATLTSNQALESQGSHTLNPSTLPIIGVSGENTFERVDFDRSTLVQMVADCGEACQRYLESCLPADEMVSE